MINQLLYTTFFLTGFWGIIQFCEMLYSKLNINSEITRKLAHVLGALSCLTFPVLFQSHWYVLIIGAFFFIVLLRGKMKNKYESIDSVPRKTEGSYLLPISIYLIYLISELFESNIYFILPLLILGISDPLAGIIGIFYSKKNSRISIGKIKLNKTYIGSLVFFLSSMTLTTITLLGFDYSLKASVMLGVIFSIPNTLVELISYRGTDNITVPLATVLLIWMTSL